MTLPRVRVVYQIVITNTKHQSVVSGSVYSDVDFARENQQALIKDPNLDGWSVDIVVKDFYDAEVPHEP
jgi:hypothetical protein